MERVRETSSRGVRFAPSEADRIPPASGSRGRSLRELQRLGLVAAFVQIPTTTEREREAWAAPTMKGTRTAADLLAALDALGDALGRGRS